MEFDIVDKSWRRANLLGRMSREVRLNRTSYHWPRKFDHVEENKLELLRTTGTMRLEATLLSYGNRCEVTVYIEAVEQDMRGFGYYPRWDDRTRWKFADRAESS